MAESNQDWESILTKLLMDANECVDLFQELETEQTWGEWVSDWVVGERGKINSDKLLHFTKKFKEEVEKLLSICSKLSRKVEWGKTMELGYQKSSNFPLVYFRERVDKSIARQFNELSISISAVKSSKEQRCKLRTVGIVTGGTALGGIGTAVALGAGLAGPALIIPVGIGLLIGSIGAIAHYSIHSRGRKRGLEYQTVRFLYDSFHDKKLLSNLQTQSIKLQNLSDNVSEQIETYKLEFGTHRQAMDQRNASRNPAKATRVYYKTKEAEIEQLRFNEPDMDEDMRRRMATRIAESSCKTFLKETLRYSDPEIRDFINDLDN